MRRRRRRAFNERSYEKTRSLYIEHKPGEVRSSGEGQDTVPAPRMGQGSKEG
jgi:hypothetical protein